MQVDLKDGSHLIHVTKEFVRIFGDSKELIKHINKYFSYHKLVTDRLINGIETVDNLEDIKPIGKFEFKEVR